MSRFGAINKEKPWYFADGLEPDVVPNKTSIRAAALLPFEHPNSDRFINQLMFVPLVYDKTVLKSILVPNGLPSWWKVLPESGAFTGCSVDVCEITINNEDRQTAVMVLFYEKFGRTSKEFFFLFFDTQIPSLDNYI